MQFLGYVWANPLWLWSKFFLGYYGMCFVLYNWFGWDFYSHYPTVYFTTLFAYCTELYYKYVGRVFNIVGNSTYNRWLLFKMYYLRSFVHVSAFHLNCLPKEFFGQFQRSDFDTDSLVYVDRLGRFRMILVSDMPQSVWFYVNPFSNWPNPISYVKDKANRLMTKVHSTVVYDHIRGLPITIHNFLMENWALIGLIGSLGYLINKWFRHKETKNELESARKKIFDTADQVVSVVSIFFLASMGPSEAVKLCGIILNYARIIGSFATGWGLNAEQLKRATVIIDEKVSRGLSKDRADFSRRFTFSTYPDFIEALKSGSKPVKHCKSVFEWKRILLDTDKDIIDPSVKETGPGNLWFSSIRRHLHNYDENLNYAPEGYFPNHVIEAAMTKYGFESKEDETVRDNVSNLISEISEDSEDLTEKERTDLKELQRVLNNANKKIFMFISFVMFLLFIGHYFNVVGSIKTLYAIRKADKLLDRLTCKEVVTDLEAKGKNKKGKKRRGFILYDNGRAIDSIDELMSIKRDFEDDYLDGAINKSLYDRKLLEIGWAVDTLQGKYDLDEGDHERGEPSQNVSDIGMRSRGYKLESRGGNSLVCSKALAPINQFETIFKLESSVLIREALVDNLNLKKDMKIKDMETLISDIVKLDIKKASPAIIEKLKHRAAAITKWYNEAWNSLYGQDDPFYEPSLESRSQPKPKAKGVSCPDCKWFLRPNKPHNECRDCFGCGKPDNLKGHVCPNDVIRVAGKIVGMKTKRGELESLNKANPYFPKFDDDSLLRFYVNDVFMLHVFVIQNYGLIWSHGFPLNEQHRKEAVYKIETEKGFKILKFEDFVYFNRIQDGNDIFRNDDFYLIPRSRLPIHKNYPIGEKLSCCPIEIHSTDPINKKHRHSRGNIVSVDKCLATYTSHDGDCGSPIVDEYGKVLGCHIRAGEPNCFENMTKSNLALHKLLQNVGTKN